ncbi:MAG: methyl-accepting chemotaxis protein [Brevinema sp.]
MAYDNIKKIVTQTTNKILILWVLLFSAYIGFIIFYNIANEKNQFINKQILTFSEINTEITSVLYYNSQQNIASDIDYTKTLLSQWMDTQRLSFSTMIPATIPEINFLNELGQEFYSTKNLKNQDQQIQNFQNLSDQLDLLKRMSLSYVQDSLINKIMPLVLVISIGLLFIMIVITLIIANTLQKKLIIKNEFILEDIWNELQGMPLHSNSSSDSLRQIPYPDTEKIHNLIQDSENLSTYISQAKELLVDFTPKIANNPKLSEKIAFIQKLLSRLFTRTERATALAKAANDNGFQAGILALNISIEAARSGDSGRNFLPISDRVKDFGEKSAQIGKAIIEELNDVDLSIRKAYAMGKGIIEELSSESNEEQPLDRNIQDVLHLFNQILQLSQYIKNISNKLETNIEVPTNYNDTDQSYQYSVFLREILIRSFDRLYRFNYGIDPPSSSFREDR